MAYFILDIVIDSLILAFYNTAIGVKNDCKNVASELNRIGFRRKTKWFVQFFVAFLENINFTKIVVTCCEKNVKRISIHTLKTFQDEEYNMVFCYKNCSDLLWKNYKKSVKMKYRKLYFVTKIVLLLSEKMILISRFFLKILRLHKMHIELTDLKKHLVWALPKPNIDVEVCQNYNLLSFTESGQDFDVWTKINCSNFLSTFCHWEFEIENDLGQHEF